MHSWHTGLSASMRPSSLASKKADVGRPAISPPVSSNSVLRDLRCAPAPKEPSPRLRGEGSRAVPHTVMGEGRSPAELPLTHSFPLNHRAALSPQAGRGPIYDPHPLPNERLISRILTSTILLAFVSLFIASAAHALEF